MSSFQDLGVLHCCVMESSEESRLVPCCLQQEHLGVEQPYPNLSSREY